MTSLITTTKENTSFSVNPKNGQLVSFKLNNIEFMHGAGKPDELLEEHDTMGWTKSDDIMFPIVGPVKSGIVEFEANNTFENHPHDQHGIVRLIKPTVKQEDNKAIITYNYIANTRLKNPKHNTNKTRPEFISCPYSFILTKTIEIKKAKETKAKLQITFTIKNNSGIPIPFQFGYHPAFKADLTKPHTIKANKKEYTVENILEAATIKLDNTNKVKLQNNNSLKVKAKYIEPESNSKELSMMIWTPSKNSNMICLEPVSSLELEHENNLKLSKKNAQTLDKEVQIKVDIKAKTIHHK